MAEKDIIEKTFDSYNDIFADIVNGLLFNGEQVIKEDELEDAQSFSVYKDDDDFRNQDRDVSKYWKNGKIKISFIGLENQSKVDDTMPLRIMGYDGAAYRSQVTVKDKQGKTRKSNRSERYPVLTLVLYFGKEKWNRPRTLLECFDVPEKLKPFVSDYKINVFEIAHLTKEQLDCFKTSFKIVAAAVSNPDNIDDYKTAKKAIEHYWEFVEFIKNLTNDISYESLFTEDELDSKGGEGMCEFFDRFRDEGRNEAKNEERKKTLENVKQLLKIGNTIENIKDIFNLTEEELKVVTDEN